jgi:hypothetical protein
VGAVIRHGEAPYLECSSKGDKRFSAFYAKVGGKSIEDLYQGAKKFENGDVGRNPKGRAGVNQREVREYYASLWDQYIAENPHLVRVLCATSGLSDVFGQPGSACQATELWRIRSDFML